MHLVEEQLAGDAPRGGPHPHRLRPHPRRELDGTRGIAEGGQRLPGQRRPALPCRRERLELGLALNGERGVADADVLARQPLDVCPLGSGRVHQRRADGSHAHWMRSRIHGGGLRADPVQEASAGLEQVIEEVREVHVRGVHRRVFHQGAGSPCARAPWRS